MSADLTNMEFLLPSRRRRRDVRLRISWTGTIRSSRIRLHPGGLADGDHIDGSIQFAHEIASRFVFFIIAHLFVFIKRYFVVA